MGFLDKPIDIFLRLLHPLRLMFLALQYLPGTILSLLSTLNLPVLLSPRAFKRAWFARFWTVIGPMIAEDSIPNVQPLMAQASGVVLDIGPGVGTLIGCFDKHKVTRVLGVEPNEKMHEKLRERIREVGLEGIYEIVPFGVEELIRGEKGLAVDSVVTVQCLCSVEGPKKIIKGLYGLLREGGNWLVYEHVVAKEGRWVGWYQSLIDLIWPHFLGGCSITRDTERYLKEAGPWSKVDLGQLDGEPEYSVLPRLMGVLVK